MDKIRIFTEHRRCFFESMEVVKDNSMLSSKCINRNNCIPSAA